MGVSDKLPLKHVDLVALKPTVEMTSTCVGADLTTLTVCPFGVGGEKVRVKFQIKDQGNGTGSGSILGTSAWVSVFKRVMVTDTSGATHEEVQAVGSGFAVSVPSIPIGGASGVVSTEINVGTGDEFGTKYFAVVAANSGKLAIEQDLTNNTANSNDFEVHSRPVIETMTVPQSITLGSKLTVSGSCSMKEDTANVLVVEWDLVSGSSICNLQPLTALPGTSTVTQEKTCTPTGKGTIQARFRCWNQVTSSSRVLGEVRDYSITVY